MREISDEDKRIIERLNSLSELDKKIIARVQGFKWLTLEQIAAFDLGGDINQARTAVERLVTQGFLKLGEDDYYVWVG